MLWQMINRLKHAKKIDEIILAIPDTKENNILEKFAKQYNLKYYRGSENDVLSRYYNAAKKFRCYIVVRLTSDCPLIDPEIVDKVVEKHLKTGADYTSNILKRTFPRGLDTEVFNFEILEKAQQKAKEFYQREHVTPYIWKNPKLFKLRNLKADKDLKFPHFRWTVDTKEDLQLIKEIYKYLYKPGRIFYAKDVIDLFNKHPELIGINIKQKGLKEK